MTQKYVRRKFDLGRVLVFFRGPGESAGRVLVDFSAKKKIKKIMGRGRVLSRAIKIFFFNKKITQFLKMKIK